MAKKSYEVLTASETLVMKCIWDADKEMSLADIFEMVNSLYHKEWKYQTVSTFLAKIVQKGFIRARREGHRVIYEILISQDDYKAQQADEYGDSGISDMVGGYFPPGGKKQAELYLPYDGAGDGVLSGSLYLSVDGAAFFCI